MLTKSPPSWSSAQSSEHRVGSAPQWDERGQKLRQSCDTCAQSKIKCDRIHPRCGRCVAAKLTCIYGISRKHGKKKPKEALDNQPPLHARRDNETDSSTSSPAIEGFSSPQQHPQQRYGTQSPWSSSSALPVSKWTGMVNPTGCSITTHSSVEPPEYSPVEDWNCVIDGDSFTENLQSIHAKRSYYGPSESTEFNEYLMNSEGLDISSLMGSDGALSFDISSNSTSSTHEGQGLCYNTENQSMSASGSAGTQSCYSRAIVAFESLNTRSFTFPGCSSLSKTFDPNSPMRSAFLRRPSPSASGQPALTFDQVLGTNRTVVNTLLDQLSCQCAWDPHLAMLYGSITSKVFMLYRIAGRMKRRPASHSLSDSPDGIATPGSECEILSPSGSSMRPQSSAASTSGPCSERTSTMSSEVSAVRIRVGDFDLEEEDQEALLKQILLSELRKAGLVAERMAVKHSEAPGDSNAIVGNLYGTLGDWLKMEFLRTVKDIEDGG